MKSRLLQLFATLLLLVAAGAGHAQTTIFDYGTSWKYLDNGTDQGTAWRNVGFNDASWASDTGFFGYADSWITKYVNACGTVTANPSCTNKYITTYFRKIVNIPSTSVYDSMILSIKRDDAVVVYVNGVEVWRDANITTGAITYTTRATSANGGATEYTAITKTIPMSFFTNGNNTIAVEVHQESGTSSDLGFNMQMIATPSLTFFDYKSAWKYLDNGTDQGTAWRNAGFNDASWASDTGFFGYGDTWITKYVNACGTVVTNPSCTNKYITTYFRKVLNVPNPALYDSIRLYVSRDDGFVAYVNGTEVFRDNMPAGTPAYNTSAPSAISGTDEYTPIFKSIPISAFTTGNNTIAIEMHQNGGTSSDLSFTAKMVGVLRAPVVPVTLIQGPYLQMGNKTAVSLRWRTNVASKSKVEVGTVLGTYPIVVSDNTLLTEHEIRVTGLTPDTKYYYRIGTDTSVTQGDVNNFFVTAPADTSNRRVTIAVFGDCGRNDNSFQTGSLSAYQNYLTAQGMKAADIMQLVGDNAYNNGTDAEFSTLFFNAYKGNIMKNHMLFPLPGNHDYDNGSSARQADHNVPYYSLFTMPQAGECGGVASGTEAYYSYDWGANVHVLSLDSYGKEDAGSTRLYDTLGAQVRWIKQDLAANTKKWVVVLFHHPPFTMGSHNSDNEGELVSIRQNFIRILERYGVDMVICGHSHDYERSYLLKGHYGNEASFNKAAHTTDSSSAKYDGSNNSCPYNYPSGKINHGTVYVVSGSAGADGGVQSGYPHNALPFSIDDGGMFFLDIKDNRLDAKFLRRNSTIADQFTIIKDTKVKDTITVFPGTPVALKASWPGAYAWNTGATTAAISVAPMKDTVITVKDSLTRTCLTDEHFIDVVCTTPVFTACPSNITSLACNTTVTYNVTDTGTPNPTLTYTFAGATTASGFGTGSGSTFNVGVTTVTIAASNVCGDTTFCSFTVTVNPTPAAVTVTGAGTYCDHATITADNGADGTMYFQSTTSGGTSTAHPSTSEVVAGSGTYYFRALSAAGCWGPEGSVTVTINPYPTAVVASGAGTFCDNATITATGGTGGTIYFQGTTPAGVSNVTPTASNVVTATGTYYYRAQSAAGCWSTEGSVHVTITPLPATTTVSGSGTFCGSTSITAAAPGGGTIYYQGTTSGGTSTASTLRVVPVTASGTYYFRTLSAAGCWSPEGSATVTVNPLPVVHSVTGGGGYCAGDAGAAINLNGSEVGISYQLYMGTTAIGSPVAGTNSAISLGMQPAVGTYSVTAVDDITACTSKMTGSATVSINPLPVAHVVTGGGNYCTGSTGPRIGLKTSTNGINYQLYRGTATVGSPVAGTGAAADFGIQSSAGTYTVVAVNPATLCKMNMTGSTSIAIDPLPVAYTVTGGGNYCAGSVGKHILLSGSQSGISYQLYNGTTVSGMPLTGSGPAIDFGAKTAAGSYTVVAKNPTTGCTSTMVSSAPISVFSLPVAYSVTGGGSYCAGGTGFHIGLGASENGVNYQLYNGATAVGAPVMGTAGALDFGIQTAAGTYTVAAANATTACTNDMTGAAAITVNALPDVYAVTGGGRYCTSGTGVHIKLAGSTTGVNYQLYNGATRIGSPVAGKFAVLDFGAQKTAGTYTVVATDAITGCSSNMSAAATVSIDPLPAVYTVTGGGSYCADGTGVHVNLSGSQRGVKYQLFNGGIATGGSIAGSLSAIDFGSKKPGGKYTVTGTDTITGCVSTMTGSATINVIPNLIPSVYVESDKGRTVCAGDLITFTTKPFNEGTDPTYVWQVNGVDQSVIKGSFILFPKNGDVVTATLVSSAVCASPKTAFSSITMKVDTIIYPSVAVTANPGAIAKPGQKVTFTAAASSTGAQPATYQWYVNANAMKGATTSTFSTSDLANGDSVSCTVTRQDACERSASSSIVMSIGLLGTNTATGVATDIRVLPNPNKGTFSILGSLGTVNNEQVALEITNMLGQVVYKNNVTATAGSIDEKIQLQNVASGMYILNVHSAKEHRVFHIVIDK